MNQHYIKNIYEKSNTENEINNNNFLIEKLQNDIINF